MWATGTQSHWGPLGDCEGHDSELSHARGKGARLLIVNKVKEIYLRTDVFMSLMKLFELSNYVYI